MGPEGDHIHDLVSAPRRPKGTFMRQAMPPVHPMSHQHEPDHAATTPGY